MSETKTVPYERFKQKVDECNYLKAKITDLELLITKKEIKTEGFK